MSLNNRVTKLEEKVSHLEKHHTQQQQANASEKHKGAEPSLSVSTDIIPANQDKQTTQGHWYETLGQWLLRHIFRFKILEGVGIIAAIIYAGITYKQWQDLRHHFEVDQRAWLRTETVFPASLGQVVKATVTVKNVGKSPTLEIFGGLIVQIVDHNHAPVFPSESPVMRQVRLNMLFPSDPTSFESGVTPNNADGTPRTLSDAEVRKLSTGEAYLAAFGTIVYLDQFGEHWTRFCAWRGYQPGPTDYTTASCATWNSAGDGPVRWGGPGN